jgi:hypothetical protein
VRAEQRLIGFFHPGAKGPIHPGYPRIFIKDTDHVRNRIKRILPVSLCLEDLLIELVEVNLDIGVISIVVAFHHKRMCSRHP